MTFPITPNPAIHTQPKGVGQQQMLYTGGQLKAWSQQLPLAMTLQLMDAILKALGVSQSVIDSYNQDETAYYNSVQTNLGTVNTDVAALQADSTASTAAFSTLLTSWEAAITGYTNWSTFIAALETAWTTYSTTESGLTSSAIFTLQNLFNTLLGISPSTGLMAPTNVSNVLGGSSLGADVSTVHTTASNASTWSTRLTNDLLITSDVFHLVYAAGSSSDAPGTIWSGGGIGNGKPTWYSAWNDLLSLAGVVNSTSAPTDAAPTTGTVIQANTAAATTAGTNASIAISNASAANTLAQGTVDGLYQAFNGGSSTGNAVSTVKVGATAIPASNVVGNTGATPVFGAVGGGNFITSLTNPLSTSWTHTIATGDLGVLVIIAYQTVAGTGGSGWTSAVTYGGTAMTMVGSTVGSGGGSSWAYLEAWWLKTPATGTQTVAVSIDSGGVYNATALGGNSYSASGSKIGNVTPSAGGGSGTTQSITASSATGRLLVGALGGYGGGAFSAFNQTQRYNHTGTGTYGIQWDLVFGDAAGASSVTFSATTATTKTEDLGLVVEITN